jgi:hypothetical protein
MTVSRAFKLMDLREGEADAQLIKLRYREV